MEHHPVPLWLSGWTICEYDCECTGCRAIKRASQLHAACAWLRRGYISTSSYFCRGSLPYRPCFRRRCSPAPCIRRCANPSSTGAESPRPATSSLANARPTLPRRAANSTPDTEAVTRHPESTKTSSATRTRSSSLQPAARKSGSPFCVRTTPPRVHKISLRAWTAPRCVFTIQPGPVFHHPFSGQSGHEASSLPSPARGSTPSAAIKGARLHIAAAAATEV